MNRSVIGFTMTNERRVNQRLRVFVLFKLSTTWLNSTVKWSAPRLLYSTCEHTTTPRSLTFTFLLKTKQAHFLIRYIGTSNDTAVVAITCFSMDIIDKYDLAIQHSVFSRLENKKMEQEKLKLKLVCTFF